MSGIRLLDRLRRLGKPIRSAQADSVSYAVMCTELGKALKASVLLTGFDGAVLGHAIFDESIKFSGLFADILKTKVDPEVNDRVLEVLSDMENAEPELLGISADEDIRMMIVPVAAYGERLASLMVYRRGERFDVEDVIAAEYIVLAVGLCLYHEKEDALKQRQRSKEAMIAALDSLSPAELSAMVYVFRALGQMEGVLVASHIAAQYGISRSVIVNALRKLEGAGVIEARSFGMKGTFLKVRDKLIFDELEYLASRKNL